MHYHSIKETLSAAIDYVVAKIKHNPVLLGTAAVWAYQAFTSGAPVTLAGAVTIVVGFLVRAHVVPAHEVPSYGTPEPPALPPAPSV